MFHSYVFLLELLYILVFEIFSNKICIKWKTYLVHES